MNALRKVVDSSTLTDIFDLPSNFKGKKIEVILFPVEESIDEKKRSPLTMAQIDEWAQSPDIQSLVGVLKETDLPQDITTADIRNMRLTEK